VRRPVGALSRLCRFCSLLSAAVRALARTATRPFACMPKRVTGREPLRIATAAPLLAPNLAPALIRAPDLNGHRVQALRTCA